MNDARPAPSTTRDLLDLRISGMTCAACAARIEKVLNRPIHGYRNHYLSFKVPDTWHLLEQAGFGTERVETEVKRCWPAARFRAIPSRLIACAGRCWIGAPM